jgi:hypothetical protein
MKNTIALFILLFSLTTAFAGADHSGWDALLKKNVSSAGKVNYKGFRTDKTKLEAYLKELENNVPSNDESANAKKAFWVNAYNAYTVLLIVDNYPVRSINDIKLGGATPWARKWIKIDGTTMSLNDIENNKLRKVYNDGRIHFVINCASFSCPILLNQAYTAENIESNLTAQTKKFINDDARNQITSKSAKISSVFDWYRADFGDVTDFINKYSKTKIGSNTKISYMPYSWDLNE